MCAKGSGRERSHAPQQPSDHGSGVPRLAPVTPLRRAFGHIPLSLAHTAQEVDRIERTKLFLQALPGRFRQVETEPGVSAQQLQKRLNEMMPELYSGAQLRTLQRRVKAWRANRAKELVTRILDADAVEAGTASRDTPALLCGDLAGQVVGAGDPG